MAPDTFSWGHPRSRNSGPLGSGLAGRERLRRVVPKRDDGQHGNVIFLGTNFYLLRQVSSLVFCISVTRNCRATMHVTHIARRLGPTLADVILPDGTNVNHTLVKDGWCWWYRKYAAAHHSLVQSLTPHPPVSVNVPG